MATTSTALISSIIAADTGPWRPECLASRGLVFFPRSSNSALRLTRRPARHQSKCLTRPRQLQAQRTDTLSSLPLHYCNFDAHTASHGIFHWQLYAGSSDATTRVRLYAAPCLFRPNFACPRIDSWGTSRRQTSSALTPWVRGQQEPVPSLARARNKGHLLEPGRSLTRYQRMVPLQFKLVWNNALWPHDGWRLSTAATTGGQPFPTATAM